MPFPIQELPLIYFSVGVMKSAKIDLSVFEFSFKRLTRIVKVFPNDLLVVLPLPSELITVAIVIGTLSIPLPMLYFTFINFSCSELDDSIAIKRILFKLSFILYLAFLCVPFVHPFTALFRHMDLAFIIVAIVVVNFYLSF